MNDTTKRMVGALVAAGTMMLTGLARNAEAQLGFLQEYNTTNWSSNPNYLGSVQWGTTNTYYDPSSVTNGSLDFFSNVSPANQPSYGWDILQYGFHTGYSLSNVMVQINTSGNEGYYYAWIGVFASPVATNLPSEGGWVGVTTYGTNNGPHVLTLDLAANPSFQGISNLYVDVAADVYYGHDFPDEHLYSLQVHALPEPSAMLMAGLGLAAFGFRRKLSS